MANEIVIIHAKKYIDGSLQDVYYPGTYRPDGWVYFNDDTFYRYNALADILQLLYIDKNIWITTNSIQVQTASAFNMQLAGQLAAGMGVAAVNPSVENAVQWAENKATTEWITYDYTTGSVRNVNSSVYNCSTFVITAFWQAGFNLPSCYNTVTMVDEFIAAGFQFIPMQYTYPENLLRGDIQIKQYEPYGHTNIYLGNNRDVDAGGNVLDIFSHTIDNWNRGGWDGILRYVG